MNEINSELLKALENKQINILNRLSNLKDKINHLTQQKHICFDNCHSIIMSQNTNDNITMQEEQKMEQNISDDIQSLFFYFFFVFLCLYE